MRCTYLYLFVSIYICRLEDPCATVRVTTSDGGPGNPMGIRCEILRDGADAAWVDYILFPPMNSSVDLPSQVVFSDLSIYPNPAIGEFNILLNAKLKASIHLQLFDTRGRLVSQQLSNVQNGENSFSFKLDNISEGLYFLNISDGVNSISRRIVVKR